MARHTVYIVQAICWKYNDNWFYRDGDQPIRAFISPEAAEAERITEEWKVRRELMEIPPKHNEARPNYWSCNLLYTFGSLESITSLTLEEFRQRVEEIGLPEFYADSDGEYWEGKWWVDAWTLLQPHCTDLLWNLFDRLRFFEVIAMAVDE